MQWTVSNMERTSTSGDLSDVVTILHWQVSDSDGEHHGRRYGTASLGAPDAASFTAFDSVTHEQAVGWAKDALGEQVAALEASVAKQIQLSKKPVTQSGVPSAWNLQ